MEILKTNMTDHPALAGALKEPQKKKNKNKNYKKYKNYINEARTNGGKAGLLPVVLHCSDLSSLDGKN